MGDNNLHIQVFPKGDQAFDSKIGLLTLPLSQVFEFGIKEYFDEYQPVKDEYDSAVRNLDKDKTRRLRELDEKDQYGQQFIEEKYKAIVAKQKDGTLTKKDSDTYQANYDAYKRGKEERDALRKKAAAGYDTEKGRLDEQLKQKKTVIDKKYENVRWVRQLVGAARPRLTKDSFNESLGKGNTLFNTNFGEFIEGGGCTYIEPFFAGQTPKGSTPFGCFVNATGTPDVLTAQWTDTKEKVVDKMKIRYGSTVKLHVYTQGMYGKYLKVQFKDDDGSWDADDVLKVYGEEVEVRRKYEGGRAPNSPDFFVKAPVDVYKFSEPPPGKYVSGGLIVDDKDKEDLRFSSETQVQKSMFYVFLDPFWADDGGEDEIEVYPVISFVNRQGKEVSIPFKDAVIYVGKSEDHVLYPTLEVGNKPVLQGNVAADVGAFHPCRYETVRGEYNKGNEKITVNIYPSEGIEEPKQLTFPLVAGVDKARQRFVIALTGVNTTECAFHGTGLDHQGKVIDIAAFEKLIKAGRGKHSEKWRLVDYKGKGSGKVKDEDEENDDRKIDASSWSNKFSFTKAGSKILGQQSYKVLENNTPFVLEQPSDERLELEVGYDFSEGKKIHVLEGLARSLWPNSESIAQKYPVRLNTCARSKSLDIQVYPDTKWTIQLAFNYNSERFNKVREEYHDKWTLQEQKLGEDLADIRARQEGTKKGGKKNRRSRSKYADLSSQAARASKQQKEAARKARGQSMSQAFHLMKPKAALADGLIDCEVAFVCEFDRPYQALELSAAYEEMLEFLKKILKIKRLAEEVINGTNSETNKRSPQRQGKTETRMQKLEAKLAAKKAKSNWSFEFIPPSLGLSVSWYAEAPKDLNKPVLGTMIEGVIDLDPLFGIEIKYDLYHLLYKIRHPVVLAVVATLDILDETLGNRFDIDLDLVVTSEISGTLKGTINTAEGSEYAARLMKDDDDSPAKLGGGINISITGLIRANGDFSLLGFKKQTAYAEVNAEATTGISVEASVKADRTSIFAQPEIKFEGFVLKASVNAGIVDAPTDSSTNYADMDGLHYDGEGSIVVLDPYAWDVNFKMPIIN
ncbi:hypothetical protein [Niabella hirudinis]|uniref:hypothetical protein n=1 Tax=Niabella hirudinis TaxID=1285929 RepID=UPI003EBE6F5D